jgi:hypothetical protein
MTPSDFAERLAALIAVTRTNGLSDAAMLEACEEAAAALC